MPTTYPEPGLLQVHLLTPIFLTELATTRLHSLHSLHSFQSTCKVQHLA